VDSRPVEATARGGQVDKRMAFGADQPSAIRLPLLRFSVIFLSCNAKARAFNTKSGRAAIPRPPGVAA